MNPLVLVEESPSAGSRHELQEGAVLGREGCEVVLADPEVSRRHARISSLEADPAIEDLDSTNGTFLNGQRVTGVAGLKHGDALTLGNSSLRVEIEIDAGATRLRSIPEEPPDPGRTTARRVQVDRPAPSAPVAAEAPSAPVAATPVEAPPPVPRTAPPPVPRTPEPTPPPSAPSPAPTSVEGARGDVPAPPPASASRVHQAFTGTPVAAPHTFQAQEPGRRRGSAATRVEATVISYGVVIATAIAVVLYLIERG